MSDQRAERDYLAMASDGACVAQRATERSPIRGVLNCDRPSSLTPNPILTLEPIPCAP